MPRKTSQNRILLLLLYIKNAPATSNTTSGWLRLASQSRPAENRFGQDLIEKILLDPSKTQNSDKGRQSLTSKTQLSDREMAKF
jgi:hypothetical protein